MEGWGEILRFEVELKATPHPSPLPIGERGKGGRPVLLSRPEFDSEFQVDVARTCNSVNPIIPLEVELKTHPSPQPSPHRGEGERGLISVAFKA